MSKEYQEFINRIVGELQKLYGSQYRIKVNQIIKNNGSVRHGICMIDTDVHITPTIYMEEYYALYQNGVQMQDIIQKICNYNETARNFKIEGFDINSYEDLDEIKHRVVYRLVNTAMNKELLEKCPHINVLDLSIIFQVIVCNHESGQMVIPVQNAHMEKWGLEVEQLKELAEVNTRRMFLEDIIKLSDMVRELSKELLDEDMIDAMHNAEGEMF